MTGDAHPSILPPSSFPSTPARSRTRNASFEARHDVRFTTRAQSAEGEGVEPAFPLGETTLAPWPGHPYPATFRYPVETVGIEPTTVCLQDRLADPWYIRPRPHRQSSRVGSNHRSPPYQRGVFPLDHRTIQLRRSDSNRRRTAYETVLESNSSPLRSDQGGSRTHKHQALDLTAMPVRAPGQSPSVVTVGVEPTPNGF